MSQAAPILHLVCGKAAAGKSTLTAELGREAGGVVIAEDAWLAALFADRMASLTDYAQCAIRLRDIMEPHVVALLAAGVSVVLDFPANTVATRRWMRRIIDAAEVAHRLHVLDVPDAVCKARIEARNARGDHPFTLTDAQFDQLLKHFEAPSDAEGFHIVRHQYQPGAADGNPTPR